MASTNSTAAKSSSKAKKTGSSSALKQTVRARVTDIIKTSFSSTLGTMTDIVNLVMALIQRESSFNPNSIGILYSSSHQKKYLAYSAIASAYSKASAEEKANITNGARAYGLMQVTGYYIIQGADSSGTAVLQKARSDLAGPLMITPGTSVASRLTGEANIDAQITAGLIVLEDKYKNVAPKLVSNKTFTDRTTATFAAYLGLGASDGLGTTPQAYANSIIRGTAYAQANGGVGPDGLPLSNNGSTAQANTGNTADGPVQTAASGQNLAMPGC